MTIEAFYILEYNAFWLAPVVPRRAVSIRVSAKYSRRRNRVPRVEYGLRRRERTSHFSGEWSTSWDDWMKSQIKDLIYEVCGQKVMLDFDLARIYGCGTSAFNQQIKRNLDRFPQDFSFQLTKQEFGPILLSLFVTSSWGGRRSLPHAFTEQGIYMLMTVLRCKNFTSSDNKFLSGQKGGTRKPPFAFAEQGIYTLMTVLLGNLTIRQSKTVHRWVVFNERKWQ